MDSKKNNPNSNTIIPGDGWDQSDNTNEIFISDFDSMISTVTPSPVPSITIGNSTSWDWNSDTIHLGDIQPAGSSKIKLDGHDADIEINGESLMATLRDIRDCLGMLRPNPALEKEWDELKDAGDRYRELERKFEEKSKMWQTLKDMPPPEIK